MRFTPSLVGLAGLALAVTACSGSPDAAPAASSPPAVPLETPAPSPSPSPTQPAELKVGATQAHSDGEVSSKVTVLRVRQPLPATYPPDRKGYEYVGVEVRVCLVENTSTDKVTVSWGPWSLVFGDDTIIQSPSSWSPDGFSVTLYPNNDRVVPTGRCVRGWIPFEVRKGAKPALVSYQPYGGDSMEWTIR